ncbi:MAG TPA: exodeoxyribonuclease VII small subunit [Polyangiales bacterium]|jgi:exodeoxyribonuclease VII small subunit|nr:exodeoxyribonuclease VII small subunit [Polyangiales bacterium]
MATVTQAERGNGSPAFEEILTRLNTVVEKLESGDMTLEDSLALFEEGVRLSRLGSVRLDEAERRIERLLSDDGKTAAIASPEKENEAP